LAQAVRSQAEHPRLSRSAMATVVHPSSGLRPLDPSRVSAARPWDQIQVNNSSFPRHGTVQPALGRIGSQTYTQVQAHSPPAPPRRLVAVEKQLPVSQFRSSQSPQHPAADVVHTARSHLMSPQLAPRSPALPSRLVTNDRAQSVNAPVAGLPQAAPQRARSPERADTTRGRSVASSGLKTWAAVNEQKQMPPQVTTQPVRNVRQPVKPHTDAGSFSTSNQQHLAQLKKQSDLPDLKLPAGAVPSKQRAGLPLRSQVRRHSTLATFPLAAPSQIEVPFAEGAQPEVERGPSSAGGSTKLELDDGQDLIQSTFPNFAPLLEAARDYARLSGCRFLGHDFRAELQGSSSEDEMPVSRTFSEDIGNSPMARWKARANAAPMVKDFASRLQHNNEPDLEAEINLAFHLIMLESARNVMVGKCRELDIFPPEPSPADVDEADCKYEDMSASLLEVAQRLYNDEVQRRDPALQKVGKALVRRKAMLASFLVDFATEAGWQSPQMPEPQSLMMQEFARKVGEYEHEKQGCKDALADDWDFLGLDVLAPWRPAGRKLRDLAAKLERSFSRSPDARKTTDCHRKAGLNRYRRSRSYGQQVRFDTDEEDAVDLRAKPRVARHPMAQAVAVGVPFNRACAE